VKSGYKQKFIAMIFPTNFFTSSIQLV